MRNNFCWIFRLSTTQNWCEISSQERRNTLYWEALFKSTLYSGDKGNIKSWILNRIWLPSLKLDRRHKQRKYLGLSRPYPSLNISVKDFQKSIFWIKQMVHNNFLKVTALQLFIFFFIDTLVVFCSKVGLPVCPLQIPLPLPLYL